MSHPLVTTTALVTVALLGIRPCCVAVVALHQHGLDPAAILAAAWRCLP